MKSKAFIKKFSVTAVGSTAALIVPLLVSPVISRLYIPEEFAKLAVLTSLVAIISSIVSGQIHLKLFDGRTTSASSYQDLFNDLISIVIQGIVLVILFFIGFDILKIYWNIEFELSLLTQILVVIGVIITSINALINGVIIKEQKFNTFSSNKILVSFIVGVSQLLLGFKSLAGGLMIGYILGLFVTPFHYYNKVELSWRRIRFIRLKRVFTNHRSSILYLTPSILIGQLSSYMPIFLIPQFHSLNLLGQYAFGMKLFQIPLNVFSRSIQEVFKQESYEECESTGKAFESWRKALKSLLIISVLPFCFFYLIIEKLVVFAFGPEWLVAGTILKIMSPSLLLKFIAGPLSFILILYGRQKLDLLIQGVYLVIILGVFYVTKNANSIQLFRALNIVSMMLYLVYFLLSYRISKKNIE